MSASRFRETFAARLGLVLATLSWGTVFAQPKPVTLEALWQYRSQIREPVSGDPIWAPDGRSFAYRRGSSVLLYDASSKRSRELVSLSAMNSSAVAYRAPERNLWENRRARELDLQWSSDGRELLYSTNGDLFLIDVRSGKWRQLTRTNQAERDAKLSPDGRRVAFYRDWDVYSLDLKTGSETRLTNGGTELVRNGVLDWVYPEELQMETAYWWSPDSRAIAYLQFDLSGVPQYPHADLKAARALSEPQPYPQAGENNPSVRLGVVAAEGGPTAWFDIGDTVNTHLVARVGWTADSKAVFAVRTNRVQNELEFLLFDRFTGRPNLVYRETDPYWINVEGDPIFLADGSAFLWTSERDGFRHLYRYPLDGAPVRQLTKGDWQVTALSGVDEAAGRVYYVSSEANPLERQLYSVQLDGAGKRRVTRESGTHRISMSRTCEYFLDVHSTLTTPPRAILRSSDGREIAVHRAAQMAPEELALRPTEIIQFQGPSGDTLYGSLMKPAGFDPNKRYPVIVNVYGGPRAQTVRDAWPGATVDQVLAHRGFLVWQLDNRGSSGRGHAFESPLFRRLGLAEVEDQRAGIRHLVSLGLADPNRIGVTGWSYGGFMTLNLLLTASDVFRAGFAGAPVTNWLNYDSIYTERYMGLPKENDAGYRSTALPSGATNLKGALKIVHNIEDDNVLFQNTMQMVNALTVAGKQFELMVFPGKSHSVTASLSRELDRELVDFFERHLKSTGEQRITR